MELKTIDVYIGNKLKGRRKVLGLTQRAFAKEVNFSYQQIQKYEQGENRIGASTLYKFADILGVDIAYFLDGYNKSPLKRKKEKSFKYSKLNVSTIEELVSGYSELSSTAQKNVLMLIRNLNERKPDQ